MSTKKLRKNSKRLKNYLWYTQFGKDPTVPCTWCAKHFTFHEMTVDHEPPLSEGGTWLQAVLACKKCNNRRNAERIEYLKGLSDVY